MIIFQILILSVFEVVTKALTQVTKLTEVVKIRVLVTHLGWEMATMSS